MKKAYLLILTICVLSCNKSQNNNLLASNDVYTNSCFALDSIRYCANKTNNFCSDLPLDVYFLNSKDGNFNNGYSSVLSPDFQPSFDNFSWQSFVALNWAADSKGNPTGNSITENMASLRVWEHFTDAKAVFNEPTNSLKSAIENNSNDKLFFQTAKIGNEINISGFLEADNFPLIDKNKNFVIYEVKMNSIEKDFIKKNHLTTIDSIYSYSQKNGTIQLPENTDTKTGSIEIKASWRILDSIKGDDFSRYYTKSAAIFVDADNSTTGKSFTIDATVGLVGLHILRKTQKFTNWIWTTFEHVDNVPDNLQEAQNQQETNWSFYNPACLNCPPNIPPKLISGESIYKWSPTAPHGERYAISIPGEDNNKTFGTQVSRVYPIYYCTDQLNTLWQTKLKTTGSVFANYKLVGSQWMIPLDAPPFSKINAPHNLGNTTAETYMQETSSCIGCHSFAGVQYISKTNDTINIPTDFSFTFLNAK